MDAEFIDDGRAIDLVSIAIVAEDGRTYYAISLEYDASRANDWVKTHVLSKLPERPTSNGSGSRGNRRMWKTRKQIKSEILKFIGNDTPEFWGYYADYDWVVFCRLFGSMVDLPKNFPAYCRDIKQFMDCLGVEEIPFEPEEEHCALSDAHWNQKAYEWLSERAKRRQMA